MEKIIFANGSEFDLKDGASLGSITVIVPNFAELEKVEEATKDLSTVQFATNGEVSGEYENLVLVAPLFHGVERGNDGVEATLTLREKTEMEKAIDELKAGQDIQDGAIIELAEMMG